MRKAVLFPWQCFLLAIGLVRAQNETKAFHYEYGLRNLSNGLTVLAVRTDFPNVVSLNIPVQVGSRNEVEQGKSGFAHFFEHMMFRGTENYTSEEYFAFYKSIGASINAFTTPDYTSYYATLPSRDSLEAALSIEADRFKYINYTEDAFKTEAGAIMGEYNLRCASDPYCKLSETQRNITFTTHPYKHEVIGLVEDIKDMPNQFVHSMDFYSRYYRPEKTSLVLVGDLDINETIALVEKYWGDWERGSYNESIPQEPPGQGPIYEHIVWEAPTLPFVTVAFRGPAYSDTANDMATMDVAFYLAFSSRSPLYKKLVLYEQKVETLGTSVEDSRDPFLVTAYAVLYDVNDMWYVRDEILKAFADLRVKQVSSQSVADTVSFLRYSTVNGMDSSFNIASKLVHHIALTRDPEAINRVYQIYEGITAQDILSKANIYFTDDNLVVLTLASVEDVLSDISNPAGSVDSIVNATQQELEPVPTVAPTIAPTAAPAATPPTAPATNIPSVLRQTGSNLANFNFRFRVGAMDDPAGKEGLAALTAAMITEGGSSTMSYEEISDALFPMAAGFQNVVDKELTSFKGQVHVNSLDDFYEIISNQLLNPGWNESDFSRLKTRSIAAITDGIREDPEALGLELLNEIIFEDHPYGNLNYGHVSSLESITLEDVRNFYQENYVRANLVIGMAGGFSDEFYDKVNADMNSLPLGTANEHVVPRQGMVPGARAVIVARAIGMTTIQFGFPIPVDRSHPDYAALLVANTYFGAGLTSRLFISIRESRGLTYSPRSYHRYYGSSVLRGRQEQIFQVYISEVETTEAAHFATRVALYEFDKFITNGMSQDNFDINRGSILNSINLLAQTQGSLLDDAMDDEYYGIDDFATYLTNELESLSLDRVNEVITEHLQNENVTFVFVTSDATNLRDRLVNETVSSVTYPFEPPTALLEEDKIISNWTIGFNSDSVQIINASQVFETKFSSEIGSPSNGPSSGARSNVKVSSIMPFAGFLFAGVVSLF